MRQQRSADADRRDAVVPLRSPLRSSAAAGACLLAQAPDALTCAPVGLALRAGLRPHCSPPGRFQGVGCAHPCQRCARRPQELARLRPAIRERACARVGTARCAVWCACGAPPRDARGGRVCIPLPLSSHLSSHRLFCTVVSRPATPGNAALSKLTSSVLAFVCAPHAASALVLPWLAG